MGLVDPLIRYTCSKDRCFFFFVQELVNLHFFEHTVFIMSLLFLYYSPDKDPLAFIIFVEHKTFKEITLKVISCSKSTLNNVLLILFHSILFLTQKNNHG